MEIAATRCAAFETSARGSGIAETRFGLAVFADVYEPAHKVLVAERCHGILRLLPSCIFNYATSLYPSTILLLTIKQAIIHYL
jgi:hypothetical protein